MDEILSGLMVNQANFSRHGKNGVFYSDFQRQP
jgi:hypothetical protein